MPQIPGLDYCKFLKCLASSMDCGGASSSPSNGGAGTIGGGARVSVSAGVAVDNFGRLVSSGVDALNRARDVAEQALRDAERRAADLAAAEKTAAAAAKAELQKARKEAEKAADELRGKVNTLGATIGSMLPHL